LVDNAGLINLFDIHAGPQQANNLPTAMAAPIVGSGGGSNGQMNKQMSK